MKRPVVEAPTLARALGAMRKTIRAVNDGGLVTADMAFRVARLANASIDDLLAGKSPPPGMCPHCERSAGESPVFGDEETLVE